MAHQNRFPAQTANDNFFSLRKAHIPDGKVQGDTRTHAQFFRQIALQRPHAHNIHDIQHAEEGRFAGEARPLFTVGLCATFGLAAGCGTFVKLVIVPLRYCKVIFSLVTQLRCGPLQMNVAI
ncbi:hypothetical protein C8R44DRAFT_732642 [Mycena epipterygia]|nr:hypothetical protein C8R44DRAFT_732642 [Mycena epipterygia]